LTREHVLPAWLKDIGLELTPSAHLSGPLNRLPRQWSSAPFNTTVRLVCASCNNGWLSALENLARPVLTPLIRGESRHLSHDDQAIVAAWTCKTALISLLITSPEARGGDGVPPSEYTALYEQQDHVEPLPVSQYWIGSYRGDRASSIWVTPFVVQVIGPDSLPENPSGYAMTLVLGELLVQGVRFTQPALQVELKTEPGLLDIWPLTAAFSWPTVGAADDAILNQIRQL
jgi:hypothetical protein